MIYDVFMTPLEIGVLRKIRKQLMGKVAGDVLEIGFGTGANIPYIRGVNSYTALDLEIDKRIKSQFHGVDFVSGDAHHLGFSDESFDTVVCTLVLCSVHSAPKVLREIYRVLKPGGHYIFIEHILPQKKWSQRIFNHLNPLWYKVSQSCQLTHHTDELINTQFNTVDGQYTSSSIFYYGKAKK